MGKEKILKPAEIMLNHRFCRLKYLFMLICSILWDYCAAGAPTGHVASHEPQSIHVSASITYFPSPSDIADTGQASAHAPHIIHSSEIWYAI